MDYFCDTYALYSFVTGNESYGKYFRNFKIATTKLNLIELFYIVLRDYLDLNKAREYYRFFLPYIAEVSDDAIEKAMQFKLKHKEEKVSYVDCIVYALSQELGIKFLTGDEKFKDKQNVEFVK